MAPSQTLKWVESGKNPSEENVEIEGTEPYIVGGHTASGYWVDSYRETTIKDLFAAGDVAGGCPQKYVTGALVEGEIAANRALEKLQEAKVTINKSEEEEILNNAKSNVEKILNTENPVYSTEELEEAMQKIMDEYAGGIKSNYGYSEKKLDIADYKIKDICNMFARCTLVGIITGGMVYCITRNIICMSYLDIAEVGTISIVINLLIIMTIGLNNQERIMLIQFIKNKICNKMP